MSRVNFYTLRETRPEARLAFACRLAEKAAGLGLRVHISTATAEQSQHLDDLLWQFRADSFLPHRIVTGTHDDRLEVVTLGHPDTAVPEAEVLINLEQSPSEAAPGFGIINEIILGDSASLEAGRERWRFYRSAGHDLHRHTIA